MNDEIKIEKDSGRDMTPRLIGETYMKKATPNSPQRYRFGVYECQYCGEAFESKVSNIKNKNTKSCGCLYKGQPTHGLTSHRFYKTWTGVIHRCNNPKNSSYKDYGGRGITVCDEWLDVTNFVAWCEETYPNIKGYSLDRIDNDKGYSPENCRWADKTTQAINQRIHRNNTSGYTGIHWNKDKKKWSVRIAFKKERVHIGSFPTKEEAVLARDNYIIENSLPYKLSTDYKKEN